MEKQSHLHGQLQDEDVQLETIARGSPGLHRVHQANFFEQSSTSEENKTGLPTLAGLQAVSA